MNSFLTKLIKGSAKYNFLSLGLLLLCLNTTQIYAQQASNKNISIQLKNEKIADAFKKISKASGYKFFYDEGLVKDVGQVNINVSKSEINQVLRELTRQT